MIRQAGPARCAVVHASVIALVSLLTGCAAGGAGVRATADGPPDAAGETEHATDGGLPSAHVHGVASNPGDGLLYLASHDGLFRYDDAGPTRVGPVIDLMGFTVAGPDHFYASGHPGPGTDLPNPVGLIESRDAGQTWTPLSRQGESDFHTLTASGATIIGSDGTLRRTDDAQLWTTLDPPVEPYAVAAAPGGSTVLATSQSGPIRSTDSGGTWSVLDGAPLLQLVAWADARTAVGVTPDGAVAVSRDEGVTWEQVSGVGAPPQALSASISGGELRILVVTDTTILESTDGGNTFGPIASD